MRDDFLRLSSEFLRIQKEVDRLNRAMGSTYLKVYEDMGRSLEPIRRYQDEISRSMKLLENSNPLLTEMSRAARQWQEVVDRALASSRYLEELERAHSSWREMIRPSATIAEPVHALATATLTKIAYRATIAERIFSETDLHNAIHGKLLREDAFRDLGNVIDSATSAYGRLSSSITDLPEMTHLPAFVFPGATREVVTSAHTVQTFAASREEDAEDEAAVKQLLSDVEGETSSCIEMLRSLDPALSKPYVGARTALKSGNVDRTRHVLTSLRELWTHVLRRIAPDEKVIPWTKKSDEELLHNDRPTRKARILYVCRDLNCPQLSDFVAHDTQAFVKMVELFNRVHELELNVTDEQLRGLMLRSDSWLWYVLRIRGE